MITQIQKFPKNSFLSVTQLSVQLIGSVKGAKMLNDELNKVGCQNFDMKTYLKLIGVPYFMKFRPNVETLFLLTNKHLMNINFYGADSHLRIFNPVGYNIKDLMDITTRRRAGICWESSGVLYHALSHLGFDTSRIMCRALLGKSDDPLRPHLHPILHVKLDGKRYLIDIGFGMNSLRYPLEVKLSHETEEISLNEYEHYQLEYQENYYQLNMKIKDNWMSLWRFENPIQLISQDKIGELYEQAMFGVFPVPMIARDEVVLLSKVTEEERIGIQFIPEASPFFAERIEIKRGIPKKTRYDNFKSLQDDALQLMGFKFPERSEFKKQTSFIYQIK